MMKVELLIAARATFEWDDVRALHASTIHPVESVGRAFWSCLKRGGSLSIVGRLTGIFCCWSRCGLLGRLNC